MSSEVLEGVTLKQRGVSRQEIGRPKLLMLRALLRMRVGRLRLQIIMILEELLITKHHPEDLLVVVGDLIDSHVVERPGRRI